MYAIYTELFFLQKNWKLAEENIAKHLTIAENLDSYQEKKIAFYNYAKLYKFIEDYKNATLWYDKHFELYTKNINNERIKMVTEAAQKFESERNEKEAEIYKLKHIQLKNLNIELVENKELLQDKNQQLNNSNIKLSELAKELKNTIITNDKMYSVIAHDLRNPISAIVSCTDLIDLFVANNEIDEIQRFVELIRTSSKQVVEILENMLEWSKANCDMIVTQPTFISINDIIKQCINLVELITIQKDIKINFDDENQYHIFADNEMLKVIIRILSAMQLSFHIKIVRLI